MDLVADHKPMIIGLSETWITEDVYDREIDIHGYTLFRCDRRYGGVMLYIHEPLKATRYYAPDKYEYEDSVWCTVEF